MLNRKTILIALVSFTASFAIARLITVKATVGEKYRMVNTVRWRGDERLPRFVFSATVQITRMNDDIYRSASIEIQNNYNRMSNFDCSAIITSVNKLRDNSISIHSYLERCNVLELDWNQYKAKIEVASDIVLADDKYITASLNPKQRYD